MKAGTKEHLMEKDQTTNRLPLLDLRAIWSIVRIRAPWILATWALVVLAAIVLYLTASPTYSAEARIGLERQVEEVVAIEPESRLSTDSSTVDTEVQVIQSLSVADRVVDDLKLAERPGFGFVPGEPAVTPEAARSRAIGVLRENLWTRREGLSYAISVGFDWGDAQTPAEIVNGVVQAYVAGQESGQNQQTDADVKLLADRLESLRDDVISAEAAVSRYREGTGLVDIFNDDAGAYDQLSGLNSRLAEARSNAAMASSRVADARRSAIPEAYRSSVLSSLRSRRAELAATEAALSERYRPGFQEIVDVQAEAAALDRQIAQEEQRVRDGLAAEERAAQSQVGAIQNSIGNVESTLGEANRSSVRLAELERNAEAARVLYSALLERYRQAVASQGSGRGNAYIISSAQVPSSPSSPDRLVYIFGAIIAGLLASSLVVLLLETLERGVRSRRGLEAALGVPVVASTPDLRSVSGARGMGDTPRDASDYALTNSTSVLGEAMRGIRTHLKIGQPAQHIKSLAVTSAIPGEGKTTTALTLARTTARAGYRVVLVDCDERQRAASRTFPEGRAGLGDVLSGAAMLEDALLTDPETGLFILPQLASSAVDHDLFSANVMKQHIEALSQSFDLVILDTPPVLPTAGSKAIAGMADGTLFVVRWRSTPIAAAQTALDQLNRAGARVEGSVLSFVDVRTQAKTSYAEEAYQYQVYGAAPA